MRSVGSYVLFEPRPGERVDPFRGKLLVNNHGKNGRITNNKNILLTDAYEQRRYSISGRSSGTCDAALLTWLWLVDYRQD